jgi:hypothetical protein
MSRNILNFCWKNHWIQMDSDGFRPHDKIKSDIISNTSKIIRTILQRQE